MNTLSLHRIKHLFASYFISNWQKECKTFLIVFIVNILFAALFSVNISLLIIAIMCLIYAGKIFGKLGNNNSAINYLTLPANTEEKLLVNITLTHIYYPIILLIVSILGILCGNFLITIFRDQPFTLFDSFVKNLSYEFIINLLVTISIFMFASVYFRKNAITKLLLIFVILFFISTISILILGVEMLMPDMVSIFVGVNATYSIELFERLNLFSGILNYVVILFFWVISYFRLRETEA